MSLVTYEGDSSEEEEEEEEEGNNDIQTTRNSKSFTNYRFNLPPPLHPSNIDDNDEYPTEANTRPSSTLLANLPKPQDISSLNTEINSSEFVESELEDIVRGDKKEYTKNTPQLPQSIKRKRDGPVKIFIPAIEQVKI